MLIPAYTMNYDAKRVGLLCEMKQSLYLGFPELGRHICSGHVCNWSRTDKQHNESFKTNKKQEMLQ